MTARCRPGSALGLIRAYKLLISPYFTGSCRFLPSCADYAAEAIARHGVCRGSGWRPAPGALPSVLRRRVTTRFPRRCPESNGKTRSPRHLPVRSSSLYLWQALVVKPVPKPAADSAARPRRRRRRPRPATPADAAGSAPARGRRRRRSRPLVAAAARRRDARSATSASRRATSSRCSRIAARGSRAGG